MVKFVFMAALAEMEHNLIRERTIKGERGKGGRPKAITEAQETTFKRDMNKGLSLALLAQKYDISKTTAYRLRRSFKNPL
ncbi:DNA-invertase hin [[Pasteurella] mairii]|uniref:DNA-invertase hin n=1 Tax=[Pasteurella] mairii TaxID=757 RepID=A0A379B4V4_9PAST|nr:DNA-invertase hin [[Pasteurella] mairii]